MFDLIGLLALVGLLVWFFARQSSSAPPAPEDDVTTPLDRAELAEAERELADDPHPRALSDGWDGDEDDWGPGAT